MPQVRYKVDIGSNILIQRFFLGDKTAAINAILDLVSENIEKENHIMQDRFGNRVIKAMVKADNAEEANDKGMLA